MGWFLDNAVQNETNRKFSNGDRVEIIMTQEDWSEEKKDTLREIGIVKEFGWNDNTYTVELDGKVAYYHQNELRKE